MATQDQFAPDLLLGIDREASEPMRAQLERALRDAIRDGRLHAGTRLPSSRALAGELGISRGVVVEAFAQLSAEGYLVARQGAPTRVAAVVAAGAADARTPERVPMLSDRHADEAVRHARPTWAGATPAIDLRPWAPDLSAFPRAAWLASMRAVLREAPDHALGNHMDLYGAPELRAVLAAYLGRSRGVATAEDRVVITSGMTQAVGAVGAALRARGVRAIAVEDPGFSVHRLLLASTGLRIVPIAVDDDGIDVDALAAADAEAVLVAPAHQYPRGAVLAPARRTALLAWARERDAWILEDDYDGEYRYDREPVGALQGLDPERVIYLGSASKMLAPALRLGWAAAPAELTDEIAMRRAMAGGGSWIDQLALADLIERGELDRHLRRMRPRYRRRRELLLAAIGELLPDAQVVGVAAGLSFLVLLPGIDENAVVEAAGRRGIAVWGLEHFRAVPGHPTGDPTPGLIIGYGALPEAAARRAIAELAAAIADV